MQKFLWFVVLCGVGSVAFMVPLALGGLEVAVHFAISFTYRLIQGGPVWEKWEHPVPRYIKVRLFNITNPKDFADRGEKPKLQEVGPYVYREVLEKVDITRDDYADTLRYRQVRVYYFEPKMSHGKETDMINMVNIAFVSVAKMNPESSHELLDEMLTKKGEKLTRKHTVREILFDGFQVKYFIEMVKDPKVQAAGNVSVPEKLLDGKYGMFKGKNGSDDGWFEVKTGSRNSPDYARLVSWNGMQVLDKWKGEPCNTIRGTDGIIFEPFLTQDTDLGTFVPEICRSLMLKYQKIVDHNGISTLRFTSPKSELEKNTPENRCYCPYDDDKECPPEAVISISTCFEGAPMVMSWPHFLYSDRFTRKIEGLSANEEEHLGFFDFHPMTGVIIEAKQRIQFSILVQPWPKIGTFQKVPKIYLPILWTEEGSDLDDLNKTLMKLMDFGLKLWGFGKWVAVVFWLLVTAGAIALIMYNRKNTRVELIDEKDDDD